MKHAAIIIMAGLGLSIVLSAAPAAAQNNRSFVSGQGLDSNPCSLTSPCRGFQKAHDVTNAGGEITVLDPAGYGAVTITKAISIVNDGVGESTATTLTATPAITIAAGAGDVINLVGITFVGLGVGTDGVRLSTGGALNMRYCKIGGFTADGIRISAVGDASVSISDTVVSGNGAGIVFDPGGSGKVTGVLKRVEVSNHPNGDGLVLNGLDSTGSLSVTFADSIAANNLPGIIVSSTTGKAATKLMVSNSQIVNNNASASAFGISVQGSNATAFVGKTTITGNSNGWSGVNSYGDNYVNGNGGSEGAMPVVAQK